MSQKSRYKYRKPAAVDKEIDVFDIEVDVLAAKTNITM